VSGPDEAIVARVDAVLATFLDERSAGLELVGPELRPIAAAARQLVLDGGKRMRPRFTYWGWRAAAPSGASDEDVIVAAASLELVHACALAHDDVIDSSATRRGNPTTHVSFGQLHASQGWSGSSQGFGEAAAVLLGDLLLTWADTLFARAGMPKAARRVYDDMRQLVMAGQYLDVLVQAQAGFSPADALRVAEFKTSKYTIEGPLHLGAAAAGASHEVIDALSSYALPLGIAFQLRDDVLGVFGDPAVTGKPAGDDLLEGKHTLLTALAMDGADADQRTFLRDNLGRSDLGPSAIEALRSIIVDTGALAAVEERIAAGAADALAALAGIDEPTAKAALIDLAAAATQRHT